MKYQNIYHSSVEAWPKVHSLLRQLLAAASGENIQEEEEVRKDAMPQAPSLAEFLDQHASYEEGMASVVIEQIQELSEILGYELK